MEKKTPQFNLETEELASHAEALRPWRREVACTSPEPPSRRMTLEIFLESDTTKKRVLVERWVFRHDARVSAGPSFDSESQSLSVSAAYKQLVVFFRTLHAELRALPAHRYARRASLRSASGNPARGGFAVAFEVSGERTPEGVATGEDSKPPPRVSRAEEKWSEPLPHENGGEEGGRASDTSTSLGMSGVSSSGILSSGLLHSSSSEGTGSIPSDDAPKRTRPSPREDASSDAYRTYAFAAAAAPGGGRLDASVYFLDADALAALDLGDMRETCKACKPTLVDAYAHEARGGSGSGSDGYASSPGGFFVGDKKTTSAFPRRAGSWKARATQFLATSPGSAKVGFAARAEPEDVDTPPPQPRRDRARRIRRRRDAAARGKPRIGIAQRGDGAVRAEKRARLGRTFIFFPFERRDRPPLVLRGVRRVTVWLRRTRVRTREAPRERVRERTRDAFLVVETAALAARAVVGARLRRRRAAADLRLRRVGPPRVSLRLARGLLFKRRVSLRARLEARVVPGDGHPGGGEPTVRVRERVRWKPRKRRRIVRQNAFGTRDKCLARVAVARARGARIGSVVRQRGLSAVALPRPVGQ